MGDERKARAKENILTTDVLIIDEISMISAKMLSEVNIYMALIYMV